MHSHLDLKQLAPPTGNICPWSAPRKINLENAAFARFTVNPDKSVTLLHNSVDCRQTHLRQRREVSLELLKSPDNEDEYTPVWNLVRLAVRFASPSHRQTVACNPRKNALLDTAAASLGVA